MLLTSTSKLQDLDLDGPTVIALQKSGIRSVKALTALTPKQLLMRPRIGAWRVQQIQEALGKIGLKLADTEQPEEKMQRNSTIKRYTDVQCPVCKVLPGVACEPGPNNIGPRKPHPERLELMKELKHGTRAPKTKFEVRKATPADVAAALDKAKAKVKIVPEPVIETPPEPEGLFDNVTAEELLGIPPQGDDLAFRVQVLSTRLEYQDLKIKALEKMLDELLRQGLRPVVDMTMLDKIVRDGLDGAITTLVGKKFSVTFNE